jgi:hypothetical protein
MKRPRAEPQGRCCCYVSRPAAARHPGLPYGPPGTVLIGRFARLIGRRADGLGPLLIRRSCPSRALYLRERTCGQMDCTKKNEGQVAIGFPFLVFSFS